MQGLEDLKSWWILPRSMRFKPPALPGDEVDGIGQAKGSICPGHFIPAKSKEWNKILNRSGPLEYPPEMPVDHGEQWDMSWKTRGAHELGLSAKATAPVATAAGLNVNADAKGAFTKSVSNYMNFDKLDTYMIQPWDSYIEDSLIDAGIDRYIKDNTSFLGAWEVYMISGIVVARGATVDNEATQNRAVNVGVGAGASGLVEGDLHFKHAEEQQTSMRVGKMSDFVWAIRIARVHKDVGHSRWTWETLWDKKGKGSTFTTEGWPEARQRFERARSECTDEGLAKAAVFGLDTGRNVFIVPTSDETETP